jgi:5-methylcytosine-specific restriction protein B
MVVEQILEWLVTQKPFATNAAFKTNSPESVNRKNAMQVLRSSLEANLADEGVLINGESVLIGMSSGQGIDTSIPYLSFSAANTRTGVTQGWSLTLMAQQQASGVSFAIGLGVYKGAKKSARIAYTDKVLEDKQIPLKYRARLNIGFSGLAKSYASSSPLSLSFSIEELTKLSDEAFLKELHQVIAQFNYVLNNYSDYPVPQAAEVSDRYTISVDDESDLEGVFRALAWTGKFLRDRPGEKFLTGEIAQALVETYPQEAEQKRLASKQDLTNDGLVKQIDAEIRSRFSTGQMSKKFPQIKATTDSPRRIFWESDGSTLSYDISSIQADGSFMDDAELSRILDILQSKKNIILQGPPGTGKTWLAKRLAYAQMGEKASNRVVSLQFHSNMSYEDFVRGWRPMGDGRLSLVDGPFLELVKKASDNPGEDFALVIEELNRGNPAQIFGELLTLIEANKRTEDNALRLTYPASQDELVFVPENIYVIGTMNMADKSLALMDFAFRRRFGFITLEPQFNEAWSAWLSELGLDSAVSSRIKAAIDQLNHSISNDPNLGPSYAIGHSFFTPNDKVKDANAWLNAVVDSEIEPALQEYWFDDPASVTAELLKLKTQLFE